MECPSQYYNDAVCDIGQFFVIRPDLIRGRDVFGDPTRSKVKDIFWPIKASFFQRLSILFGEFILVLSILKIAKSLFRLELLFTLCEVWY